MCVWVRVREKEGEREGLSFCARMEEREFCSSIVIINSFGNTSLLLLLPFSLTLKALGGSML